eukprot:TRINITY_DN15925_c0_g1_i1.p2 TRINITY_DN15925_c0_g1~~TRINITY_DN15925_c0_g1_i1.p2  ORF type:complete len:380 (-),score=45.76 TRINITY_DN15925_c0_g1_i1:403-1542(-)
MGRLVFIRRDAAHHAASFQLVEDEPESAHGCPAQRSQTEGGSVGAPLQCHGGQTHPHRHVCGLAGTVEQTAAPGRLARGQDEAPSLTCLQDMAEEQAGGASDQRDLENQVGLAQIKAWRRSKRVALQFKEFGKSKWGWLSIYRVWFQRWSKAAFSSAGKAGTAAPGSRADQLERSLFRPGRLRRTSQRAHTVAQQCARTQAVDLSVRHLSAMAGKRILTDTFAVWRARLSRQPLQVAWREVRMKHLLLHAFKAWRRSKRVALQFKEFGKSKWGWLSIYRVWFQRWSKAAFVSSVKAGTVAKGSWADQLECSLLRPVCLFGSSRSSFGGQSNPSEVASSLNGEALFGERDARSIWDQRFEQSSAGSDKGGPSENSFYDRC